jgi:hypothetical protein
VLSRLPGARTALASVAGGEIVSDDGLRFGTTRLADAVGLRHPLRAGRRHLH